ncbi:MAG: hypothetical protein KDC71_01505 [Acidobacteria bacterium]|nr:hypothetical protein [Acidobacteriota bacterium]
MFSLEAARDLLLSDIFKPVLIKLARQAKATISNGVEIRFNGDSIWGSERVGRGPNEAKLTTRVHIELPFRQKSFFLAQSLAENLMPETGFSGFDLTGTLVLDPNLEIVLKHETFFYNQHNWHKKLNW